MTPLAFSMLRILSDGLFHSGEDMARSLGVSRASLSNAAKVITASGIELDRVRGRGYRMNRPFEWLDSEEILQRLEGRHFGVEILDSVDSSSSELLRMNAPPRKVLAAELQTCGRGRMGRKWASELGGSLTFSVSWQFDRGAGFLSGLGLATSLAVMRAMTSCGMEGIQVKWPNDLLHGFRKLGGILIEVKGDMLGPTSAVIGIGVNFRLSERTREDIDQAVTCIEAIPGMHPGRNRLLSSILSELHDILEQFDRAGFSPFREEWSARHVYHMKRVRLRLPSGKSEEGQVAGVNEMGEILLDTERGRLTFASGEVSLRGIG